MRSYTILVADPDEAGWKETRSQLESELMTLDPEIRTASTIGGAKEALSRELSVVITEYEFPDGTGFDLIREVRDACPDAGCILYTDTDPDSIDTDPLKGSITEYVGKDSVFGAERLARLVRTTAETAVQTSYPLPQNEDERLAALQSYDLDDPQLESSLNQITDLAASHFGVEQSSINIINEHSQDFLACYGDAQDWETMDREDSICTFTILEDDDVMAVEDVTEDPRFESRSEALLDLGIQSYMGANLVTSSGLVIGPLCIYDDEPRSFAAADREYLRNLASVAIDLIELHARLDGVDDADGEPQ